MNVKNSVPVSSYSYDPLDRINSQTQHSMSGRIQRFYCDDLLATITQGAEGFSFFRKMEMLLGFQERTVKGGVTSLLCVDQQNTVIIGWSGLEVRGRVYTAYGYDCSECESSFSAGYIGECKEPLLGIYLLGNGYRAYNSVLMRFSSPDSLSPFYEGGMNSYAYCKNNPINYQDNSGHTPWGTLARALTQGMMPIKTSSPLSVAADIAHDAGSKAGRVVPEGYQLVGYHGSKSKHIENLANNGLDPGFIGSNIGTLYGPGFYTAPNINTARFYAKPSQRFNGVGLKKPNSVGAVYVKNLPAKKRGVDFDHIAGNGLLQELVVIRKRMYKDVVVIPVATFKKMERPTDHSVFSNSQ